MFILEKSEERVQTESTSDGHETTITVFTAKKFNQDIAQKSKSLVGSSIIKRSDYQKK
jgi:hypothetical protein